MPFTHLLWKCLLPGKTGVQEGGKGARLRPEAEECVLVFRVDHPDFRMVFGLQGRPVCDTLFFSKKLGEEPVLWLVEFKGSDVSRAVEQIESTLQLLKHKLAQHRAEYRAVVVTNRGVPTQQKGRIREFERKHKMALKVSRDGDLRTLL